MSDQYPKSITIELKEYEFVALSIILDDFREKLNDGSFKAAKKNTNLDMTKLFLSVVDEIQEKLP